MIPYGKQSLASEELEAAKNALSQDLITGGPKVTKLEDCFASLTGRAFARASNSGTSALYQCASYLKTLFDSETNVIIPVNTFVATASAFKLAGHGIKLCDVDKDHGMLDLIDLENKVDEKTCAVVLVHFSGYVFPQMEKLIDFCAFRGIHLIEDSCHALGASYSELSPVGANKKVLASCYSLHPVKSMTSVEGGILLTDDEALAAHAKAIASHGLDRIEAGDSGDIKFYDCAFPGFNFRMSEVHAAVGLVQFPKLASFIGKRRSIAEIYLNELSCTGYLDIYKSQSLFEFSSWHLFVLKFKDEAERNKAFRYLKSNQIFAQWHYLPLYRHSFYKEEPALFPGAESFCMRSVSIPIFPDLKLEDQKYVIKIVKQFWQENK